jgi:hypothetical protein
MQQSKPFALAVRLWFNWRLAMRHSVQNIDWIAF